jgi:hypothetical protein
MKKQFVLGVLALVSVALPSVARAEDRRETVDLSKSDFVLSTGEVKSLELTGGWRNVQKIFVQADGIGREATFEVIANGDVKGTVHVPGRDPNYVVTIGESVRSLQFRHIMGGNVRIYNVKATQSERVTDDPGYEPERDLECAIVGGCAAGAPVIDVPKGVGFDSGKLAKQTITIVDRLEPWASVDEYKTYLLPIKISAARVFSLARLTPYHSSKLHWGLVALKKQIKFADPYIEETFSRENLFTIAVELQHIADKLELSLK